MAAINFNSLMWPVIAGVASGGGEAVADERVDQLAAVALAEARADHQNILVLDGNSKLPYQLLFHLGHYIEGQGHQHLCREMWIEG